MGLRDWLRAFVVGGVLNPPFSIAWHCKMILCGVCSGVGGWIQEEGAGFFMLSPGGSALKHFATKKGNMRMQNSSIVCALHRKNLKNL